MSSGDLYTEHDKKILPLVQNACKEDGRNVPSMELKLTSVESRYLMGAYILTQWDVDLEKDSSESQSNRKKEFKKYLP